MGGEEEGEFARTPPSDVGRERLLLSAMMNYPADAIEDAIRAGLAEQDFYRPAHEVIAHALICMWAAEAPVDPATVADWITRDGDLQTLGGHGQARMYLFGLWEMRELGAVAGHHAAKIHKLAVKRREVELGQRMIQRGYSPDPDSADTDIAQAEAELAVLAGVLAEPDYPLTPERFVAQAAERSGRPPGARRRPRWVIPGMMSARDRAVLVGPEGAGKSMVGLQAVLAAACGLHPFTFERIPPVRGVYIDLETPEDQLAGRVERMIGAAGRAGCDPGGRLAIWSRDGEWMRLSGSRDQHRLAGVFRGHFAQGGGEPRMVVAGPLYKLLSGRLDEEHHIAVAAFWNRVITRFDCALWLEAHAPMSQAGKRDWRPMASGVWTRWPEVGRYMRPVKNEHRTWQLPGFRDHDRDDLAAPRCWPDTIWWRTGPGWPWGGTYDPSGFQAPLFTPAAAQEQHRDAAEERADELARRRAQAQRLLSIVTEGGPT